jgi:acetyltransferase-like isoleucine patch superfamily enzyme
VVGTGTLICEGVPIDDNVFVGHGVTFTNDSYPRSTTPEGDLKTERGWNVEPTRVKKGASIGSDETILPNLIIGENALFRTGSVVTGDVPADAMVAGNPARVQSFLIAVLKATE